jgi:hypothetical protein
VDEKTITSFLQKTAPHKLEAITSSKNFILHPIREEHLQKIFSDTESVKALFPAGVIFRCYIPFQIRASNIPLIMSENFCEMFATRASTNTYNTISVGCATQLADHLLYTIEYHGHSNIAYILAHVVEHLKKLTKYYVNGEIWVSLFIPEVDNFDYILRQVKLFCNKLCLCPDDVTFVIPQWTMNHNKSGLDEFRKTLAKI